MYLCVGVYLCFFRRFSIDYLTWSDTVQCFLLFCFFFHFITNMMLYQFQLSIGFCFRNFFPYFIHNIILRCLMTSHRPWLQSRVLQQAEQIWTSPWVRLVWVDLYSLSTLSHIWNINIDIEIWSSLPSTYGFSYPFGV